MSDFYGIGRLSSEELDRRKEMVRRSSSADDTEFIAVDTSEIQQVDVDDDTPDLFSDVHTVRDMAIHMVQCGITPWFKSMSKQLPHIFVRLENASMHKKRDTSWWNDRIDVLNGQWSFARADAEVFCAESTIQVLPETYIKAGGRRVQVQAGRLVVPGAPLNTGNSANVRSLLSLLAVDRAREYGRWIEVGIVLKCLGRLFGDQEMLDAWVEFSQREPMAEESHETVCREKWDTFTATSKFSVGTLHYMAKLDSPSQYVAQFTTPSSSSGGPSQSSRSVEAKQVAEFLVNKYCGEYATAPLPNGGHTWFQFFNHRWFDIGQTPASFINQVIGRDFQQLLDTVGVGAAGEEEGEEGEATRVELFKHFPVLEDNPKNAERLHKLIGSFQGVMQIVKFAATLMSDPTFENRLDTAHHLIGFENGVYDLDEAEFRDGRPEDMVSMSTGYAYVDTVDPSIREELRSFKMAITGSEEMMNYLMDIEAYSLHGNTWVQNMYIHTGRGGNGKSVNGVLLRRTFGGYFYAPDVSMFTGKRSVGGGTSSELAKAKGRRMLLSTEPEAGDTLQAARIKYFTGGEVIQARSLYKAPIEFLPQFTIHLQMNQMPNLSSFDGGVARRLKVVPYPFQFVAEPTLDHHRPMDTALTKKFSSEEYAQQFMLMLIEQFQDRLAGEQPIHYPEAANEVTAEYMDEEDTVGDFLRQAVVQTGCPDDVVYSAVLYSMYKEGGHDAKGDVSHVMFARAAKDFGLRKKRRTRGMCFIGCKLAESGGLEGGNSDNVPMFR